MKFKYNGQWYELNVKALDSMPIGSVIAFAGSTIPTGWLECNGASITSSAYPELYALIGGTLPNYKGRSLVGQDTSDTDFSTLGQTGGSKTDDLSNAYAKEFMVNNRLYWNEKSTEQYSANYESADGDIIKNSSSATYERGIELGGSTSTLSPYAVVKWIIKAKSSVPTMASVVDDYSTSTSDAYSCNYINRCNNYSSSETFTGKYYNGSPVYSIVITLGSIVDAVIDTWTTITDVSSLGISTLVDCKAISNNGCVWSGYLTRVSNGNLDFFNGITTWGVKTLILEYTK